MILVGRNFSLPGIAYLDGYGTTKPNPTYGCEISNLFLNIIDDNNLERLYINQKKHTDLIFSSYLALLSNISIISRISDHDAILFNFNIEGIISNNPRHSIYLYQKAYLDGVSNYIKNFDTFTSTNLYKTSVDQNWPLFKGAIHEALENTSPSVRSNG